MKYQPGPYGSVILPNEDQRLCLQISSVFEEAAEAVEQKLNEYRRRQAEKLAQAYWGAIKKRLPTSPNWPSSSGITVAEARRNHEKLLKSKATAREAKKKFRK